MLFSPELASDQLCAVASWMLLAQSCGVRMARGSLRRTGPSSWFRWASSFPLFGAQGWWQEPWRVEPTVNSIFSYIFWKQSFKKIKTNENNTSPPAKKIKTVLYSYVFRLQSSLYLNSFQIMSKIMMSVFILARERCSLFISYYSQRVSRDFFFFSSLVS